MAIIIKNIITPLEAGDSQTIEAAIRMAGLLSSDITEAVVIKRSLDFRRVEPKFVSSIALTTTLDEESVVNRIAHPDVVLRKVTQMNHVFGEKSLEARPVVVGFGPAGIFAALLLAREGYRPLVIERGRRMEERVSAVENFWKKGKLDLDCNIQFGEGGAGTFSDGKLTTRINDPLCDFVTKELVTAGAPSEIAMSPKPHLGTDLLREVVISLRHEIEALGGEVRFSTALTGIKTKNKVVYSVSTTQGEIPAGAVIMATGHSARDCFTLAEMAGACLTPKAFSVGARIEHRQEDIDRALYGRYAGHPLLPPGEYQLSHRVGDRAAYTFCMCPGGEVVAAASEEGGVVTNGMSYHARGGKNANSALVVSVDQRDFGESWKDAIAFQRNLETSAYRLTGDYRAPAQSVGRFMQGRAGIAVAAVKPTYALGVEGVDLSEILPQQVVGFMREALPLFGRKLRGFDSPMALLTGVESRTSSPVRIVRDEKTLCALGVDLLYPCGEGAGYAGGIMSAAVDGIRVAEAVMARFSPSC